MDWKQEVLSIAQAGPGRASLLLADAGSGETLLEWDADRRVVSASTIKVAILLSALREVEQGRASLAEEIFVPAPHILPDSEVFDGGPQALTLDELLRWMIITSDNTATNALIRRLTMERVNAFCQAQGWGNTRLERCMLDYAAIDAGRNNYTSARDQCAMFRGIYREDDCRVVRLSSVFHNGGASPCEVPENPGTTLLLLGYVAALFQVHGLP